MSKPLNQYPALEVLFDSKLRVKVLRFLFRNYPSGVVLKDLARRVQESSEAVKKEMKNLEKISLLARTRGGYTLNPEFEFFGELRGLVLKSSPAEKNRLIKRISGVGRVRLAIVAGIFMNEKNSMDTIDSEVDLFMVADDVDKAKLRNFLKSLEAEVGKEIRFGLMDKDEFEYRYAMFDRFVRVLLEGPHEKLVNKMGL